MINSSDLFIEGVFVSNHALYKIKKTRSYITLLKGVVDTVIENSILSIPSTIRYKITTLPGRLCGAFYHDRNLLKIDARLKRSQFISILCHELIHAEQNYQGRLKWTGGAFLWLGEELLAEYRERPWEKEAYARTPEIYEKVLTYLYS